MSALTFAISLLALVVVPQQARKAAAAMRPPAALRPDTEPTVSALREAERQAGVADSTLVATRNELSQLIVATAAAAVSDTTAGVARSGVDVSGRRTLLTEQVALLGRLILRSENAPLLASYRALAQAAPMQGDPRVKAMLDSLVEIERERDSYSAVGGVDPVFVALSARANELGRNIEALADARRTAIRRELTALAPPPQAIPATETASRPLPDTLARVREREAARSAVSGVASRLARERAELVGLDAREARASELANVGASPSAMLAAALVFAAVLGFGVVLFDEVRHPRVADSYEAERATGVRVVGEIRRLPPSPEQGRRTGDRSAPTYLDPGGDGHQLIYLTIATAGVNMVMLTVTGDSIAISAVVAINFAAIAADEARETLLIDTDGSTSTVTAALRIRSSGGLAAVAKGQADWQRVIRNSHLGRDRTIDVVPSGEDVLAVEEIVEVLRRDGGALPKRYDAIVVVSALNQVLSGVAAALPVPDVLYCVRAGQTPIAELKRSIDAIELSGANVRGIVMWNAPDPILSQLRPVEDLEFETVDEAETVS
ncbi:MAG: hypothetical protein ABI625_25200 [bacterium]